MLKTSVTKEHILLGKWTREELDSIIGKSAKIKNVSKRIDFLSGQFLDLDYKENTLIGDVNTPEVLVINLERVDCFTFIDYIEAMRLSDSFSEFKNKLRRVRYRSGRVSFKNRNHFFTDWREYNSDFVCDVTEKTVPKKTVIVQKKLNEKEDGTHYVTGIQPVHREIKYIPSEETDDSILQKLRAGDYIGIYSNLGGLDVSHVGILIKREDKPYLRHASSQKKYKKVVDQDFRSYIAGKPGIIVFRPKISVI